MLNLLKYEFRKTLPVKLILLAVTAVLEIVYLTGVLGGRNGLTVTGTALLFIVAIAGVLIIGVQSVVTLHTDMNTRQSYMLFMTPHSSYAILGAKVLECGISIMLMGLIYFALGMLDMKLLLMRNTDIQFLVDIVTDMLESMQQAVTFDLDGLAAVVFLALCSWIFTVTAAFFAVTVSSALLNGKKVNALISFALFIALNIGFGKLCELMPAFHSDIVTNCSQGALQLVFAAILYIGSAVVTDRYLSV